jgi:SPX domain protein involved in polyphosphate accumulation
MKPNPARVAADYRFERKFFISALSKPQVEQLVRHHPAIFSEVYRPRNVNNIYFDTPDMGCYAENKEGEMFRVKVRIRWYGDLFGPVEKPVLELKIKRGLLGRKESFRLTPFHFDPGDSSFSLPALIADDDRADLAEVIRHELGRLKPVLINRYARRYYLSADRRFRITIDSQMAFFAGPAHGDARLRQVIDRDNTVLELKYNHENDVEADRISGYFPFRLTRSSKYVRGIESLDLC